MAIKIYIDQGHNPRSFNTGAVGNGFFEQDITFEVGRLLYGLLASDSRFEARLSRPTADTVLGTSNSSSLTARVLDANGWGADLFVSIHTNAAENTSASGTEALVYGPSAAKANVAARDILAELHLVTGLRDRGVVSRPELYVLKKTKMPAVIVELGFITNAYDAQLMAYSPGLFARGIYRGILRYYRFFS